MSHLEAPGPKHHSVRVCVNTNARNPSVNTYLDSLGTASVCAAASLARNSTTGDIRQLEQ